MSLWEEFVEISYVFLLFGVEDDDPIGLFLLLYWYLPCIADIVAGDFRCCLILCL